MSTKYNLNKNAIVRTRITHTGKVLTETARRDSGFNVAIATDVRNNSTRVFIDLDGNEGFPSDRTEVELSGRQARTLLLTLMKHFDAQGKL